MGLTRGRETGILQLDGNMVVTCSRAMTSPSAADAGVFEDAVYVSGDRVDLETAAAAVADHDVDPAAFDPGQTEALTSNSTVNTPLQRSAESAVHAHRVNHNSSKLPAYRYVDRIRDSSLTLPSPGLLQSNNDNSTSTGVNVGASISEQHPSSPVFSVLSGQEPGLGPGVSPPSPPADSTLETAHQEHRPSQNNTGPEKRLPATATEPAAQHPVTNSYRFNQHQTPPDTSPSTATSKRGPTRSEANTIQIATTSVPITPTAPTAAKQPASFPIDSSPADCSSIAAPRPQTDSSPSFCTPSTRPPSRTRHPDIIIGSNTLISPLDIRDSQSARSADTTADEEAQAQQELTIPPQRAVDGDAPHDDDTEQRGSTPRPPVSYRPPFPSSTPGRPVIPPIRSFRSSGSRKSPQTNMNNPTYRAHEDGDNSANTNHRYRSLRALEGHTSTDSSKETSSPVADEETLHTIESENTADIFMNIAREDSSSISRQKPDEHRDGDHNGPMVSTQDCSAITVLSSGRRFYCLIE